ESGIGLPDSRYLGALCQRLGLSDSPQPSAASATMPEPEPARPQQDQQGLEALGKRLGLPDLPTASGRRSAPQVAAPVQRGDVSWSTGRPVTGELPRLSAQEIEIARSCNISPTEYQQQKKRLQAFKDKGMYTNER